MVKVNVEGVGTIPIVLDTSLQVSKRLTELAANGATGHIHRAEPLPPAGSNGPPYALVQFTINDAGLDKLPREGAAKIQRGSVCLIGGANDIFISLARGSEHDGWEQSMTVLGHVPEAELTDLVEGAILSKPKHDFTHPQYGTVMSMLDTKLGLALAPH